MTRHTGHCTCGRTEWIATLDPDQESHILCHCGTCKSLSGGTCTLNQIVPRENVQVTKGEESLGCYTYTGNSGKPVHCYYCPNCTAHIYHHQTVLGDDKIVLRTGLLDDGLERFEPKAEVWGKARLPWEKEVAETYEMLPQGAPIE
ncbi:uncharacterized protein EI97DRAFT_189951 [Westerdykella ornata]|uniref:CENP-V/GFA domain-containing protein n=1 Tax=Westerdykella ornata TaxID=318751 RepID=A0A6A6J9U1_WESOR|nr:uncharacterized protein EI97DRAFT_189951 [Westerdykella ornata]KAF2273105.1 hypothetical protein EI97DRAFT_189951 [Westerdykella ornata]